MSIQEIKESIESFTDSQLRKFNQHCDCKIYDKSQATLSPSELEQVLYASDAVECLPPEDLDHLGTELLASKQLSKRPC